MSQIRIDRTGCGFTHGYRLDGPCGRGGSHTAGALYTAEHTADGWILTTPSGVLDVGQARHLLAWLTGPRQLRITVIAMGAVSWEDRDLAELDAVAPGPDPGDWQAWREWLISWALGWTRTQTLDARRLYVLAADANAVDLNGVCGYLKLASVELREFEGNWFPER